MQHDNPPVKVASTDQLGLDRERTEFERWCGQDGRWPQALQRDGSNGYRLMSTHSAWATWRIAWVAAREAACTEIKDADDKAADADYMLDSDDCIKVIRGQWGQEA